MSAQKKHYKENKEEKLLYAKDYRNREDIKKKNSEYFKEYREEHYDELNEYYKRYKEVNRDKLNKKTRDRKKNDICFGLRCRISSYISYELKRNGANKKHNSYLYYLGYSIQELREHLEKQFESWMTWYNYGSYRKNEWNDEDKSTWIWNIDHKTPRSELPYDNMDCDNFKKCWSLDNLRPLSAKQNWIDGIKRTRHVKSNKRK
jgi:hypothetical protein